MIIKGCGVNESGRKQSHQRVVNMYSNKLTQRRSILEITGMQARIHVGQ
jgi:hypothetical protein